MLIPLKQGLKPGNIWYLAPTILRLNVDSIKTRIETKGIYVADRIAQSLNVDSIKTRIETCTQGKHGLILIQSEC